MWQSFTKGWCPKKCALRPGDTTMTKLATLKSTRLYVSTPVKLKIHVNFSNSFVLATAVVYLFTNCHECWGYLNVICIDSRCDYDEWKVDYRRFKSKKYIDTVLLPTDRSKTDIKATSIRKTTHASDFVKWNFFRIILPERIYFLMIEMIDFPDDLTDASIKWRNWRRLL